MSAILERVRARRRLPPPAVCRAIRLAAGLSAAEVARELQVHVSAVYKWETGEHRPRGDRLDGYAAVLAELQRELGVPS